MVSEGACFVAGLDERGEGWFSVGAAVVSPASEVGGASGSKVGCSTGFSRAGAGSSGCVA